MRICLFGNNDIATNIAMNYLCHGLDSDQLWLFLSSRVGRKPLAEELASLSFAEKTLFSDILFPCCDSGNGDGPPPLLTFNQLAKSGLQVQSVSDINHGKDLQKIASIKPHLIVSVRFGQILKEEVINLPEFGVLNLHSGILPDYRGVMGTFWSMLHKQNEIGTTLHYINDPGVDTGNIVSIQKQSADYNRSYLANLTSLYGPGVASVLDAISKIKDGIPIDVEIQNKSAGNYYSYPEKKDLEQFKKEGMSLVETTDLVHLASQFGAY